MSELQRQAKSTSQAPYVEKARRAFSYSEIFLKSLEVRKNSHKQCCLCLYYSDDCSNFRCSNKSHFVCAECACDWEADKLCPVCKRSSTASGRKERSRMSCFYSEKIPEEKHQNELKRFQEDYERSSKHSKSSLLPQNEKE